VEKTIINHFYIRQFSHVKVGRVPQPGQKIGNRHRVRYSEAGRPLSSPRSTTAVQTVESLLYKNENFPVIQHPLKLGLQDLEEIRGIVDRENLRLVPLCLGRRSH
jgi:hypothetical protein